MVSPPQKPGVKTGPNVLEEARARDEAERQDRHHNEELNDECGRLEEDLELIKARYEMYFLGVERREPARERSEMRRRVAHLKGEFTRNTGLRFRIQTLNARFLAYERMWTRCAREKEEGTYRRDLVRARRHRQASAPAAGGGRPAAPEPAEGDGAPTPAPGAVAAAAPGTPPAKATAGPSAASAGAPVRAEATPTAVADPGAAPSPERVRALYEEYVAAKRRCGEDVSRVTLEALAATLAKQVPQLLAKYKARRVEFEVAVKDGRAVLKAVPRA